METTVTPTAPNQLEQTRRKLGLSYRQMVTALGAPAERAAPFIAPDARVAPIFRYRGEELERFYDEWKASVLGRVERRCAPDGALTLSELAEILGVRNRIDAYRLWISGFLPSHGMLHNPETHVNRRPVAQKHPLTFVPGDVQALFGRAEAYLDAKYREVPPQTPGSRNRPRRGPLTFAFLRWAQRKHPIYFRGAGQPATWQRTDRQATG